mgnify:CR=1 FL=1
MCIDNIKQFECDVAEFLLNEKEGIVLKFKEEIKKCEIVCSNCHRIRTHNRLYDS